MTIATTQASSGATQALLDAVNGSAAKTKSASAIADAQDRFLTLLTTQLKNQDPLNPMDNAQMTSQLAQISTVDGITKLNATLEKLLSNYADAEAMQASAMVGHQVMVAGGGLQLTEGGAIGGIDMAAAADQVVVSVTDPNGLVIKTLNLGKLPVGTSNFTWDGTNDAGTRAVNGTYQVSVEAKQGANKVDATTLQLAGVVSVNRSTQGTSLNLGSFGLVNLTDIKQIF